MTTLYVDNIAPNLQSKISAPNLTLPTGSVIQIVNTVFSNSASGNSQVLNASNSSVELTGLRTTITPKLANSNFLVQCHVMHGQSGAGWMHCKFSRDVNSTYQAELLENSWYGKDQYGGGIEPKAWFNYLDTGATYSVGDTITYKFYANTQNNAQLTVNWSNNGLNASTSGVTIMEIAG